MQEIDGRVLVSPQDLVSELECGHRVELDHAAARGLLPRPTTSVDESIQFLIDIGLAHEEAVAERLKRGRSYRRIGAPARGLPAYEAAVRQTLDAMDEGVEVIHGGVLLLDDIVGIVDFLVAAQDDDGNLLKDDRGRLVHEPMDAKSARSAKKAAILQVAAYAEALVRLGRPRPPRVHLALHGETQWSQATDDVIPLSVSFRERVRDRLAAGPRIPEPRWAPPVEACVRCRWQEPCEQGRREARDLSLVQGFRSSWRAPLVAAGIATLDHLADADPHVAPAGIRQEIFTRLVLQARLQRRAEGKPTPEVEVADPAVLARMPAPSDGDVWFDIEGDPHAEGGAGLEYLFGAALSRHTDEFQAWTAHDRVSERTLFVEFITWLNERIAAFPDMHVYHYAAYERTALTRLAQVHGVMEAEVDDLLRSGRLVDLYATVRGALRVSTESLSLKKIEHLYMPAREEAVTGAFDSIIKFEKVVALRAAGNHAEADKTLQDIVAYNTRDCLSTRDLDTYLRGLDPGSGQGRIDEPSPGDDPESQVVTLKEQYLEPEVLAALDEAHQIPTEERDADTNAVALLGASLDFHAREKRPAWWAIFERALAPVEDLATFSDVVEIATCSAGGWDKQGKQKQLRRTVTMTGEGVDIGDIIDPGKTPNLLYADTRGSLKPIKNSIRTFHNKVGELDVTRDTLTLAERCPDDGTWSDLPIAVLPPSPIGTEKIEKTLINLVDPCVASHSPVQLSIPLCAWGDLLARRVPRLRTLPALPHTGDPVEDIVTALVDADDSYVAVQGPPGTGKTWVGAHVIVRLIRDHQWRIGVVAQSHAAVEHLLTQVHGLDSSLPIGKKRSKAATLPFHVNDSIEWAEKQPAGLLVGGTAWTFTGDAGARARLDLMVVEEAGQFALANTISSVSMARNALLLGDPQQLPQVSQAIHAEPVNISALAHLMQDRRTMDDRMGYFLPTTHRMSSPLTRVVSRLQYDGRLHAHPSCDRRNLDGVQAGVNVTLVDHDGNTTSSPQEAERVVALVGDLLDKAWTDIDNAGQPLPPRAIGPADILIVAPFNNHVRLVKRRLAEAGITARVGTVDKFQGQQAPVVIVTMATSSSEDLPRGVDFLLDSNRINVAISRAQWAAFLVASPGLAVLTPASPNGMVLLGKFLGVLLPEDKWHPQHVAATPS